MANRNGLMKTVLFALLAAVLVLDGTAASARSSWRPWAVDRHIPGTQANGTNPGALGYSYQSLQPTPGEIRGLGSRYPDIGVAPGTAGGPTYYPRAMRPIERE
jgi:hypothetical protein